MWIQLLIALIFVHAYAEYHENEIEKPTIINNLGAMYLVPTSSTV